MKLTREACLKLQRQLSEARDRLHEVRLGTNPAEIGTGSERVRYNVSNEGRILSQIRELENQFKQGGCPVTLNDARTIQTANRRPLKPFF